MVAKKGGVTRYTPVLKLKQGELWALRALKEESKGRVVPILDFLPHKEKSLKEHSETQAKKLAAAWPRPAFLDTQHVGFQTAASGKDHEHIFKAMHSRGCSVIPVTSLARSPHFQQAVKKTVAASDNGVLIRLCTDDFQDVGQLETALNNLVSFLGLSKDETDIALDYCAIHSASAVTQLMRMHINTLPSISEWRSLTVSSGCFPPSLKLLGQGNWHNLPRAEWSAFNAARTGSPTLKRQPFFADYGIRDPGIPPDFGRASANLRYTLDANYFVRLGPLVKNGGAQHMHGMCKSLVQSGNFSGAEFSAGDSEIAARATTSDSSGGPQQWVQWCMNHHIEFVVDQLANSIAA